jgi:hypothetical protein
MTTMRKSLFTASSFIVAVTIGSLAASAQGSCRENKGRYYT